MFDDDEDETCEMLYYRDNLLWALVSYHPCQVTTTFVILH